MTGETTDGQEPAGHRALPHTSELIVEAWAPDRLSCFEQAVLGLVATFADTSAARASSASEIELTVPAGSDEEMLVALLEEVIYLLDVRGAVPQQSTVEALDDGLRARLSVVPVETVETVGAGPKAVAWHEIHMGETDGRWTARVIVDV